MLSNRFLRIDFKVDRVLSRQSKVIPNLLRHIGIYSGIPTFRILDFLKRRLLRLELLRSDATILPPISPSLAFSIVSK